MAIVINVQEDQEEFLIKLLQNLAFVNSVEKITDQEADRLSDEEKNILDQRWAKYQEQGIDGLPWNHLKEQLKKKHGI